MVSYLFFFLLRKIIPFEKINRMMVILAGILGSVSTLLTILPLEGASGLIVLIIASLLAGAANAFHMLEGNLTWAHLRPERVMIHLSTSALVAAMLYYVIAFLPTIASSIVVCLLPLCGGFILSSTKKGKTRARSFRRVDPFEKGTISRILTFVAVFAFSTGVMLGYQSSVKDTGLISAELVFIGALAATAFAFICGIRLSPTRMLSYLYRGGLPSMIVGYVLLLVLPGSAQWIGLAFIMYGFVSCDLFMWFLNAEIVSRSKRSSFEVLARACFMEMGGITLGFATTFLIDAYQANEPFSTSMNVLFATCACILVVLVSFIFTPREAMKIIEARSTISAEESLQDACDLLGEEHALSKRELEILGYLAAGRSVPYIQNDLTLSQSTVKTHVRSIYRKMTLRTGRLS